MKKASRLIPFLLVPVLLVTLFQLTRVSAATTGTVALDKTFVSSTEDVVTVTLDDADLDVGQSVSDEATDSSGVEYTFTGGNGISTVVRVQNFPLLDNNDDGIINFEDVTLSTYATNTAVASNGQLHINQFVHTNSRRHTL